MREKLQEALKESLRNGDKVRCATLRLVMAAVKDRDIEARSKGTVRSIGDDEIMVLLQGMIKQRRESIKIYDDAGREELSAGEREEIGIIENFLPEQMDEAAIEKAVEEAISSLGAGSLKEMGKIMAELRKNYAGVMDFGRAGFHTKQKLSR